MSVSQEKWNSRYRNKGDKRPTVPGYLQRSLSQLRVGTVLDVAAGDGAASLYLAAQGFEVTALDIAEQGLKRLVVFAQEQGLQVNTHVGDLEQPNALSGLAQFDNIVITLYKPEIALWPELVDHLKPGGRLLLTTFNLAHHEMTGFSRRFCLTPNELETIHPDLELLEYSTTDNDNSWMDHYLFQRR